MGLLPGMKVKEDEEQHYKRGEIFYINNGCKEHVGSEMKKDRPAIIVSCDANNKHSNVLMVVFLTSQPKKDLPTHVTIRSTGRTSEALCEQVTPIAVERINNFICEATPEEMQRIDAALMIGLGINYDKQMQQAMAEMIEEKTVSGGGGVPEKKEEKSSKEATEKETEECIQHLEEEKEKLHESMRKWQNDAIRADAECSVYKKMYEDLLKIITDRSRER